MTDLYERIYALVRSVPRGRVATYGQIAAMVGPPCEARTVGYALAALARRPAQPPVPWQRVVNVQGGISTSPPSRQRALLEREGIAFDGKGRVDLARFGWLRENDVRGPRRSRNRPARFRQLPLL